MEVMMATTTIPGILLVCCRCYLCIALSLLVTCFITNSNIDVSHVRSKLNELLYCVEEAIILEREYLLATTHLCFLENER